MNRLSTGAALIACSLVLGSCGGGAEPEPEPAGTAVMRTVQAGIAPAAGLKAAAASADATPTALFDWAERQFPQLFPSHEPDRVAGVFDFRYYPGTDLYLGVAAAQVYVLGGPTGWELLALGPLSAFTCAVDPAACQPPAACSAAGLAAAAASAWPTVCMRTGKGELVFELYPDKAPVTVANFLKYVNDGFYAGTVFHRVIANFVVQGGGFTPGPTLKTPTYGPIVLESGNGLSNLRGTLAMARTNVLNSATAQFYVNHVDNTALDRTPTSAGYAVFGKVIAGLGVVDAIAVVPTATRNGYVNVPVADVFIESAVQVGSGSTP